MIWLLQNTLGETVKEGYKQSQFHKNIIDWVKTRRPERLPELITEEQNCTTFYLGALHYLMLILGRRLG